MCTDLRLIRLPSMHVSARTLDFAIELHSQVRVVPRGQQWSAVSTGNAVPTWRGQPGHPVRLVAPHPRVRLDHRLRDAARISVEDPDCVRNLNRPGEWEAWLAERRAAGRPE